MYPLLRAIAGIALRWYYRDIQIEGVERIPVRRPLLLVVNHPNALVDALLGEGRPGAPDMSVVTPAERPAGNRPTQPQNTRGLPA